ncbi:MAG: nucleoside deaminase [Deltaproteobacteria bacterium]|nr:nucleoside deaminase [Deltaproteobacteria bacterium]MBN2674430.1 nucleoside deaminase [Deltaproteobacteria bacterium]
MDAAAHNMYMKIALDLAGAAAAEGEVPVGAIVVNKDGKIIGTGANRRETDQDPIAHAEILAIAQAANQIGFWRLEETTLYVTLEPCPMCAGAILNARIPRVVYGATDPKAGAVESLYHLLTDDRLNHRCEVIGGIQAEEAANLLSTFFQELRKQGKK